MLNFEIPKWNVNASGVCMYFNGVGPLAPIEKILFYRKQNCFKKIYTPNRMSFELSTNVQLCSGNPMLTIESINKGNSQLKRAITDSSVLPGAILNIIYTFLYNDECVFNTVLAETEIKNKTLILGHENLFHLVMTWAGDKWYQKQENIDYFNSRSTLSILKIDKGWRYNSQEDAFVRLTKLNRAVLDQASSLEWTRGEIRFMCAEKCKETGVWNPFVFCVDFNGYSKTFTIKD